MCIDKTPGVTIGMAVTSNVCNLLEPPFALATTPKKIGDLWTLMFINGTEGTFSTLPTHTTGPDMT